MDKVQHGAFAKLLMTARHAAGLTQHDLAAKAGISIRTIGNLERGEVHRPRPSTVRHLAQALDLGNAETTELHNAAYSVE